MFTFSELSQNATTGWRRGDELLNKVILVLFAYEKYSCSFIKWRLNHWCHDIAVCGGSISWFVFWRWTKVLRVWDDMRKSNSCQNFHFWVNKPFNDLFVSAWAHPILSDSFVVVFTSYFNQSVKAWSFGAVSDFCLGMYADFSSHFVHLNSSHYYLWACIHWV